jgi:hypothetical protein
MDYYTTVQAVLKIAAIVLYVLVLLSDVLPAFLKGGLRTVLSYVSVGLHIVLMPLILFGGFTLEVMICAYAVSIFAYTLARYIPYARTLRADREEKKV